MKFENEDEVTRARRMAIEAMADEIEMRYDAQINVEKDVEKLGIVILSLMLVAARMLARIMVTRSGAVGRVNMRDANLGLVMHQTKFAQMVALSLSLMKVEYDE